MENGAECIPRPTKTESLQAIKRLKPILGCRYNVFTYALNQDIVDANGKVDDFRGLFFIVGSFNTRKEAEEHINDLFIKTKHTDFHIAEYGQPIRIETHTDASNISKVYVDTDNKIKKIESERYEKDKEIYEKQIKLGQDIAKECEDEYDKDHIEHYKRQCYLAIKNRTKYETYKQEMENTYKNYEMRKKEAKDHYLRHPEHEEQWLAYFKDKLTERGELALYNEVISGWTKYRNEILDI
jgi:hypothetical protein